MNGTTTGNPIDGFTVDRDAIQYVGHGLQRPECILAERDGSLWVADARGGVVHIRPDGGQELITQSVATEFAESGGRRRPVHRGHPAQRLGAGPRRQPLCQQFRHRPAGADDPRRRDPGAARQHRRPADRQGQLRPARFEGSAVADHLHPHPELDAGDQPQHRRRLRRADRGRHGPDRRRRLRLHQRDPARCDGGVALRRRDDRPADHAAARRGGRQPVRPAGVRPRRPRRLHRWHRVRRLRQPLGHPCDDRPAVRDHAGGRAADPARRRRPGRQRPADGGPSRRTR